MGLKFDSMYATGRASMSPAHLFFKVLHVFGAVTLLFSLLGCSLSTSISDSVSSPFKWSSDSSSSGSSDERKESYQHDIRNFTEVHARSSNDVAGLTRGLAAISEKHGITDWEADTSTYIGIGEGLAKAKVPQIEVDAYKITLAQGDSVKTAAIQKGYEQGH